MRGRDGTAPPDCEDAFPADEVLGNVRMAVEPQSVFQRDLQRENGRFTGRKRKRDPGYGLE